MKIRKKGQGKKKLVKEKAGKEYELFIFDKMKNFFPDFQVIFDEKIVGKISRVSRQIDITIRGKVKDVEILYLVQCKDYAKKPADMITIGEFAAVIDDIGATKGFLLCASGFAKTIHQYAKNKNIELFTIQDINHPKWKIEIQIPVLYEKQKSTEVDMKLSFVDDLDLVDSYNLDRHKKNFTRISIDNGKTSEKLIDYINKILNDNNIDLSKQPTLVLDRVYTNIDSVWVRAMFRFEFQAEANYYFFFINPVEYSQILNHITGEVTPLQLSVSSDALAPTANNKLDINEFKYTGSYLSVREGITIIKSFERRRISNTKY